MKEQIFLELALQEGLMLTDHLVQLRLSEDPQEYNNLVNELLPIIRTRLKLWGKDFDKLPEDQRIVLFKGIGNMQGEVSMLCFTEVPNGRNITEHKNRFGSYGLVMKSEWIIKNGADRVIYIGHNSPVSQKLFACLARMNIFSIIVKDDIPLFDSESFNAEINLLSFIQMRDHIPEAEWRITGDTGFTGVKKTVNSKLPFLLSDIEYIFVPDAATVVSIHNLVENLAIKQKVSSKPIIIEFPECIPFLNK